MLPLAEGALTRPLANKTLTKRVVNFVVVLGFVKVGDDKARLGIVWPLMAVEGAPNVGVHVAEAINYCGGESLNGCWFGSFYGSGGPSISGGVDVRVCGSVFIGDRPTGQESFSNPIAAPGRHIVSDSASIRWARAGPRSG